MDVTCCCFQPAQNTLLLLLPCCLVLQALLAAGAEPDALNVSGAAPLHLAASKAALPAVQLLLAFALLLVWAKHSVALLLLLPW
jgi:ankyrin repeat protein